MLKTSGICSLVLLITAGLVYAEPNSKENALEQYKQFLAGLDKQEPASITKAVGRYYEIFPQCSQELRNKGFLEFVSFYDSRGLNDEYALIEKLLAKYGEKPLSDMDLLKRNPRLLSDLAPFGLTIFPAWEGWSVGIRKGFITSIFSGQVSGSIRQYITYRDEEMGELYEGDAEIVLPFKTIAERVGRWSVYVRNYPNSPFKESAEILLKVYGSFLFNGSGNTYIFENGKHFDEAREAYSYFVKNFPQSYLTPLVKDYFGAIQQNNLQWSDNLKPKKDAIIKTLESAGTDTKYFYRINYYKYAPTLTEAQRPENQ
jgi:hypothetical protein